MQPTDKIYVSGHTGLVGTALVKELKSQGFNNLILKDRSELDLMDSKAVSTFFATEKPDYVFHLAAKVGGIVGNKTYPADFIYENITMQNNVIFNAHQAQVKKLLFFGSVCIYPREAPTPIREDHLFTGPLEQTNEAYAIAKIAGLMMCKKYKEQYGDNFISVMPANLYGINDNFHPVNSHVIPALIRRFHEAKVNNAPSVTVWGTGKPTRDFLFADDLAIGLITIMQNYDDKEHINIGPGVETSISEVVQTIKEVVDFPGEIIFDTSKPDGTPKRYLDNSKVSALGWKTNHSLKEGIAKTYAWYTQALSEGKVREY